MRKYLLKNLIIMDGNNLCIRLLWRSFCQRLICRSFKFVFDHTNHDSFKHQCCFNGFYLTFTELVGWIEKSIWRRTNDLAQPFAKGLRYLPIQLLCKIILSQMAVSWSWRARECPINVLQYYHQMRSRFTPVRRCRWENWRNLKPLFFDCYYSDWRRQNPLRRVWWRTKGRWVFCLYRSILLRNSGFKTATSKTQMASPSYGPE